MSKMKLRGFLFGRMSFRIVVLLQLEMTGSTRRFEFQDVNYHSMMVRRIDVYRLTITK